jgi:hypothetical protein
MPDFLPLPELPIEPERGRWNLFYAFKDSIQKLIDVFTTNAATWTRAYLLNSWQNYGSPYQEAAYRLDGFGLVWLTGVVKDGTPSTTSVVFVLPKDYRPAVTLRFSVASDSTTNPAHVEITKNGEVIIEDGSTTLTSLDGIIFRVE